jgi:hypothetical protein
VNPVQLLFVGFSIVFWLAVIAILVLLVRFLLVATKAAQVYLRRHEPPRQQTPPPGPTPPAPPAPAAAPTSSVVPPMERPTPPTAPEPASPAAPAAAGSDRTAMLPAPGSDATTERLVVAEAPPAPPRRGARAPRKSE